MNQTIDRLKLFFLGLFFIGAAASWGYQVYWVWPKRACEERGAWWDPDHSIRYEPTAANDPTDKLYSATLPGGDDVVQAIGKMSGHEGASTSLRPLRKASTLRPSILINVINICR